jgi:hypothetical protein
MKRGELPITDYMAGALLGNGPVWMWSMALAHVPSMFSALPPILVWGLSLMINIAGGCLASYVVCGRAEGETLPVALRLVAAEWAFSIMMLLSTASEPSIGQAVFLLICFTAGGLIGAYLSLWRRLRGRGKD